MQNEEALMAAPGSEIWNHFLKEIIKIRKFI